MLNIMRVLHAHKPAAAARAAARPVLPRPALVRLGLLGLVLPALLLGGCGRRDATERAPGQTAPAATPSGTAAAGVPPGGCAVRVDPTAFTACEELTARLAHGDRVADEAFTRLWALPAYAALFNATDPRLVNAGILTNVTRYVYAGAAAATAPRGDPARRNPRVATGPKRKDLVDAFSWARDHRAALDSLVQVAATTPLLCGVLPSLTGYVHPDRLPDSLRVIFLIAGPDVRWTGSRMLVDAGVAAAAGPARLPRLLAAQLYRALVAGDAPEPTAAGGGAAALVATFAKLRREGVAGWIEGFPEVEFAAGHPLLGQSEAERRDWHRLAVGSLKGMQEMMPALLADPAVLAAQGTVVDDLLRVNTTYRATGFAMAALIAARLGEPRLQAAARGTPADFLAAYQEAATRAAGPSLATRPWLAPTDLADLPPFTAKIFRELTARFPAPAGGAR
ncbi:MAG: DUF5700 domain-containing putative Zn-dependent protease [Candidatus Krumholzibacteriia bacterium]